MYLTVWICIQRIKHSDGNPVFFKKLILKKKKSVEYNKSIKNYQIRKKLIKTQFLGAKQSLYLLFRMRRFKIGLLCMKKK